MKKLYILFIAIVAMNIAVAQDWQWKNPLPQGNTLNGVKFVNTNTAYAVGEAGTILKTTDGGATWNRQVSGTAGSLNSVFFVDALVGYAAGAGGIWGTSDGGQSWSSRVEGIEGGVSSLFFIDADTGYAVGNIPGVWSPGSGVIYKTTNGGLSWFLTGGGGRVCKAVFFTSSNTGYVIAEDCGFGDIWTWILKTTDGGATWIEYAIGVMNTWISDIYFINADTGFAVGSSIFKTTDGGITWMNVPGTYGEWLSITFMNENTGYAAGWNGLIVKTVNGGTSWDVQSTGTEMSLNSINFADANRGMAVGDYGVTIYTTTGGITWNKIGSAVTFSDLNSVCFPDANTGYAVGASGTIIKTSDAGSSWEAQESGTTQALYAIHCTDINTCYAAGDEGVVMKTNNGGSSWFNLSSNNEWNLRSVQFADVNTGYMFGYHYNSGAISIFKTTDGGATWTGNSLNTGYRNIYSMYFTDANTGYLAGQARLFLKTTDGGSNWNVLDPPSVSGDLGSLFFPDVNTGYICGNGFYKTTDGGTTWSELLQSIDVVASMYGSIYFVDNNTGYMIESRIGIIQKTTDGGVTWNGHQQLGTLNPQTLCFTGSSTGYVVGKGGSILKTGGGSGVIQMMNDDLRITNFPNPVIQSTNFIYKLEEPGHVELEIFNSFGQLVAEPLNAYQTKGEQEMTWNAGNLPSGLYFYRIQAGNQVGGGKIVKY